MDNQIQKYDRIYGNLIDVALSTKPSTVKVVQPLTGRAETFIIQTLRHEENGDYIFVECADEGGLVRLVLPPKVANAIASQRESLSKRRRSIASRAVMRERMARGHVPTFKKKAKGK
jgi:predicted aspartyl protease